ncbi:hypothetical protein LZ198_12245 [Myxococcus sp. K15C18031901]|uniref:hypothetical protein n=1 Tax=Myxococcus dinghuensis TaxID=2906761 RepID=UPI0020A836BA|nr:hypothetical protein [Myxococcus dinghuensis]MCP3099638.1 hypothetical protein [Myxococcus dinghuensis]
MVNHGCLGVFLAVGLVAGLLVPADVRAEEHVRCEGKATNRYEPGLRFTEPRDSQYLGRHDYTTCTFDDGTRQTATLYESAFLTEALCTVAPSPTTATIVWADAEGSELSLNGVELDFDFDTLSQIFITAGFVTAGRYEGMRVRFVVILPLAEQLLACATPWGLTFQRGPATLSIESP